MIMLHIRNLIIWRQAILEINYIIGRMLLKTIICWTCQCGCGASFSNSSLQFTFDNSSTSVYRLLRRIEPWNYRMCTVFEFVLYEICNASDFVFAPHWLMVIRASISRFLMLYMCCVDGRRTLLDATHVKTTTLLILTKGRIKQTF